MEVGKSMDAAFESVLQEYSARSEAELKRMRELDRAEHERVRDQFLLAIGPGSGQLMNLLARETRARTILEIGTSYGYSTLWLADAARTAGGKVITLEHIPEKAAYARAAMAKAGLADFVDFRVGDAIQLLSHLEERLDFVLLDLWKEFYIPCFDLFYPRLNPGAIVVADNMIFPAATQKDAREYREHVRAKADMQSVLLPIGHGIELSRCMRGVEIV
jgi:predicted O-methyltransferase YrrM